MINNQKSTKIKSYLISTLTIISLVGCRETAEDQKNLPAEYQATFNAPPVNLSPKLTNEKHKILIGVLDSGVDYNHPYLKNSIHYTLDKNGNAIGAGWDYLGRDPWPLPYIAKTKHLKLNENAKYARRNQNIFSAYVNILLQLDRSLLNILNPLRDYSGENEIGIYHGTHVAGLASFDDERIGIVPYRILPLEEKEDKNEKSNVDSQTAEAQKLTELINLLKAAINHASKKGVKIINMSVGKNIELNDGKNRQIKELTPFEEIMNLKLKNNLDAMKLFEEIVLSHPEIAFVASAGNEGTWHDGESRFHYPCGIKAKNLLCVSALAKDGRFASFTTIFLSDNPSVYTLGVDNVSTMPTYYCDSSTLSNIRSSTPYFRDGEALPKKLSDLEERDQERAREIVKNISEECNKNKPLDILSGTSMASPIAARMLAQKMLETGLIGEEAIDALIQSAKFLNKGNFQYHQLDAPSPTWDTLYQERKGMRVIIK